MHTEIKDQKHQLRQKSKSIRRELGEEFRRQASLAICSRLSAWDIFQRSDVILTYMPMRNEVDLRPLLVDLPAKRWVLPRILAGGTGRMVFHAYDPHNLIMHPFGMAEPAPDLPSILPSQIELALVPGLAFDRSGWRLGYGGGYFDRFLKDFEGVSVGVVFQAVLLASLPHSKYDISMQWLVTEDALFKINGKAKCTI